MTSSIIEHIKLLKEGNLAAFDVIYHHYSPKLFGYVFRYLKNKEDAEEIVQEVFVKIWETRSKIDLTASFDSYLFVIAYHATISLLRKRISESKAMDYVGLAQEETESLTALDELQFKELHEKAGKLINSLSDRQREIFLLSREEGLSHKEIAEKLNISENTVKNHMVSSLKFLRENLDPALILLFLFF